MLLQYQVQGHGGGLDIFNYKPGSEMHKSIHTQLMPSVTEVYISHRLSRWTRGARRIWVGGAEIIPVKDSHTRIKPLALANGHGRCTTATPERTLVSVEEWPLHMAVINL